MTTSFVGRTALVTGASKGIGRATASALARAGARVALNARTPEAVQAVCDQLAGEGCEVIALPGNVTRPDGPAEIVSSAVAALGPLELIVNTVAVNLTFGPLLQVEREAFSQTLLRNTWPTIALTQAAVAHGTGPGAAVVAVSTIGSHSIQPQVAPYCASKAALEVLIRNLAHELGPRGVRVNAVAPGLVRTDMSRALWEGDQQEREAQLLPLGRLGLPEDIAGAIVFLLSDEAAWMTGQVLDVDGGRLLVGQGPAHLIGIHDRAVPQMPGTRA